MNELRQRWYDYDKRGRRKVEPKDIFKKRYGRSPDKADALLLCFYEAHQVPSFGDPGYGAGDLGL